MKEDSDAPFFEDILRQAKLDRDPSFRERFTFTPSGFRFEQSILKGGCLGGLFLGVIVPFLLWVYPGTFSAPLGVSLVIVASSIAGWVWLAVDLTRKVVITAKPGVLNVNSGALGIRRNVTLKPRKGGLSIYMQLQSGAGMIRVFGIRNEETGHDLGVSGSHRECQVLVATIERVVNRGEVSQSVDAETTS